MSSQPNLPTSLDLAPVDLDAIRERLASAQGPQFWRSLDELAETPEFQAFVDNEFTAGTSEWTNPVSRRRMLELLGASLGLAGLTACTKQPPEKIVPYVTQPEDLIPGKPLFFATALPLAGIAHGVLVESHMGRPTKIEGNPEHPSSLGATGVYHQAAALGLYDPDRSQAVIREGRNSSWLRFQEAMNLLREELLASKGAGFRLLTETITSPSQAAQIREFLALYPEARWHQFEPVNRSAANAGARLAFGETVNTMYRLDQAAVVVALDSDFLTAGAAAVRYARDFAARRRNTESMNRLYAIEPTPSLTGAMADHRLALNSADLENFARALAAKVGAGTPAGSTGEQKWVDAIAADLAAHKGASIVIAGDQASPAVHALAHAMNVTLGNVGATVAYTDPLEADASDQSASIKQLAADLEAGKVSTILMAGGNPIYTAPADVKFAEALRKAKIRIHLGEYDDETSAVCHWHVPMAHALECWGDFRGHDGTVTLQQPLIAPLYEGKQLYDILAILLNRGGRELRDLVKEHWRGAMPQQAEFDAFWEKCKHDGLIPGTALAARTVTLNKDLAAQLPAVPAAGNEVVIRPCPSVYDGRFANNAWLQELPRPLTKITWHNAVIVSPKMATAYSVNNGDVVSVKAGAGTVTGPVWILPGQSGETITVHIGYGRTRCGKVADKVGFHAGALQTSASPWRAGNASVAKTGGSFEFAITHNHHSMEGRDIIRVATLAEHKEHPGGAHGKGHELFNMYPEWEYKGNSWGMSIDLNSCIGCNACTIACQAENNISVVGQDQVIRQREMHWIRVDRYFEGPSLDDPAIYHQPVTCMHCDNAPCENVCPVAATTHSEEGLNQMIYNRCVGTRYCSNNCPYKVRRFNYFIYADWDTPSFHNLRNPNVTVRSRGVMEKCTFCVQRINVARIEAEKEDRKIRDGEVITACQAVCPTQAIQFGNMNDPSSKIAAAKKDPRDYSLLADLNTRPRTTYLSKLRNPNPALETERPGGATHGGH